MSSEYPSFGKEERKAYTKRAEDVVKLESDNYHEWYQDLIHYVKEKVSVKEILKSITHERKEMITYEPEDIVIQDYEDYADSLKRYNKYEERRERILDQLTGDEEVESYFQETDEATLEWGTGSHDEESIAENTRSKRKLKSERC